MKRTISTLLVSSAMATTLQTAAIAQDADNDAYADEIVVTGVAGTKGKNKIETSVSVSSINYDKIIDVAPRSLAEIYRQLPGIRSESSSGGGNSNVAVRGLPLSTGGAKFLQTQEDGLPILLFGDFDFAPADGYYKADSTLARVESVRGGTASTLTTNGAGGIINLISKTGSTEGGSVSFSTGLGYSDYRTDMEYGGRITDDMYFHVGGHFQQGGDYRNSGFDTISGGQFRASLTKEFENGYVRVTGKVMDKKDAAYFPQATSISNGVVGNGVTGFDANSDSLQSPFTRFGRAVNGQNVVKNSDLADGIRSKVKSIGVETSFDVGNGISFVNKARYQDISGNFNGTFTHNVDGFENRFGTNSGASIFNGPNAGGLISDSSLTALTGNNLVSEVAYFDVELDDMSNFADELKLSKSFEMAASTLDITAGYFFMNQKFKQDWHWNAFLTTTQNNAALIDVPGQTDNGILGFNRAFGWNGNNRNYDLEYRATAPFAAASWSNDRVTLDGSIRFDNMRQRGNRFEAVGGAFDVDGDGTIDPPETDVSLSTNTVGATANFSVSNTSFSVGANYLVQDNFSVFARVSSGASFNGERQLGNSQLPGGGLIPGGANTYVDVADQYEAGLKWQNAEVGAGLLDLYVTGFFTTTEESNTQLTGGGTPTIIANEYESKGIELEFYYEIGDFNLNGTATWTDAKISDSTSAPATIGNAPQRQADLIWSVTSSYNWNERFRFGANLIGTTDSYANFANTLKQAGYMTTNLFGNVAITDGLEFSININNVFDTTGITESFNDGRIFDTNGDGINDTTIARSILGRTASATLRYRF
ncbi:Predicted sucrose-specific TonB-dependent receptor [hydrothermal vent metagenome]|uniref:Predicted sucrose-specific TonB-dependent receptor n=1 Tax=hydrothermal vent metagenome TaxID=652676 RepID=A0A3B0S099_9ZZZZ